MGKTSLLHYALKVFHSCGSGNAGGMEFKVLADGFRNFGRSHNIRQSQSPTSFQNPVGLTKNLGLVRT